MSNNTKLLCLFLKAQKIDKSSEQGYAMLVVSMVSIVMFSLLATSLVFSNLSKSRTDAFVDGQSSFTVAEAGLNKRAIEFRKKLETYSGVDGITDATGAKGLTSCFGVGFTTSVISASERSGINDFECQNYRFKSTNNLAKVAIGKDISLNSEGQDQNTYVAYTLVSDQTKYINGVAQVISIPATDSFGGLNAAEYKYVVHSTGKKPVTLPTTSTLPLYTDAEKAAINRQQQGKTSETGDTALVTSYNNKKNTAEAATAAAAAEIKSSNNTSLSMTFTNRVVPLFQFGIFYNGDIEFNSTSPMQIRGWVHSNANIYVQPAGVGATVDPNAITTFLSRVSAAGNIYNRVDAWTPGITRMGITRVLLTGTGDCSGATTPANCEDFAPFSSTHVSFLNIRNFDSAPFASTLSTPTAADKLVSKVVQDGAAGAIELKTPSPGFTRKRNYADNKIGIYYSQADMRLEMVPDRDLVGAKKTTTPWTRDQAIIPFNFTSITTSGTGTCSTTAPTAGSDPDSNYIDPTREKVGTLKCHVFTKGQLQSLRQPVMVLTSVNQNNTTATETNTQVRAREDLTLGKPTAASVPPFPTTLPVLTAGADTVATKKKILRALQVALVSTPEPVPFERLDTLLNDPLYTIATNPLNPVRQGFSNLLDTMTELDPNDRLNLLRATPNQIAALGGAWFLPAPIQRIERPTPDTNPVEVAKNLRNSGFYDGREQRWMTMLQTNIASLSVWNRDGVYVEQSDPDLKVAYAPSSTGRSDAFGNANTSDVAHAVDGVVFSGANSANGLAFDRAAADANKPVGSLQYLGLGSSDKTEGGLVFHATVNDDLNGDGTIATADDITVDTANTTQRILRKNRDNTDYIDPDTHDVVVIDYYRKYPGFATSQSPFAFAFNGGNYLPNALVLSSDQSIYVQGDFNNNGAAQPNNTANTPDGDRLPAAIVADTITALSNNCVGLGSNLLGVHLSQLKCGLPPNVDRSNVSYDSVRTPMAINAAFLSNTQISNGNRGTGRTRAGGSSFSGGVNNYIRLLEDWDNANNPYALNYTGSLISLGQPLEYSGPYLSGGGDPSDPTDRSYYNVPFRNFNYDPKFSNIEKLPPLTPKASYVQQKNFSRAY
jgi:Tfp pilus assembly protein PilX